jgi:hypothetical protein
MRGRFLLGAAVLGLCLVVLGATPALAHQPHFEEEDIQAENPWKVEDPTISTALYATLDSPGDVDYYTFDGHAGQAILLAMVIPQIQGQEDFAPSLALLGPGLAQTLPPARVAVPEGAGALLIGPPPGPATTFYEPFSQTSYWERQEQRVSLPADGRYVVAVYHPTHLVGRYTFVIGDREKLGGDLAFPFKMRRFWTQVDAEQPLGSPSSHFTGGATVAIVRWLLLAGFSALFGVFYVRFLTVHPLRMSRALLAATLACVLGVATLVVAYRGVEFAAAIPLGLAAALAGYALAARKVLSRDDPRPVPELTRAKGDPGLGHTAVIYFTHGEPETYDPIGWINQFRELDECKIAFVPYLVRPFFLYQLRKKYLQVGKSGHRQMHGQMLKSLERAFRAGGDTTTRFYLSFLDDNPRPDAAVIQALNGGASRIVVAEVFLTISNHTAEGEELIRALHVEDYVPISFTGPLYDSTMLQSMFVHRANANLDGTDKSKVGILLVGHGQPDEWDAEWATETEQEIGFRREVFRLLEADGYKPENLSLAWMEFKEPKPAVKVEEFSRNGVEKVLYFSAAISADAIHSQYDVPDLVNQARVRSGFPLVNLGAWNDDPIVVRAIKEKVDAALS